MSTTWILIIALFIVLHLLMHRGHGSHGGRDGGNPGERSRRGHGCGPGRREVRTDPEEQVSRPADPAHRQH